MQVPPIDQADCSDVIEVAMSLGLPVVRAQPLQEDDLSALNLHDISQSGPDKVMDRVERNGDSKSAYSAKPSDVAYLMHTSGTTSLPKLVPITHGALTANLKGTISAYKLTSSDSCLHILPFFHIAGIAIGLLPTLASGGCAVVPPVFDPLSFPQLLKRHNVTWFTAVPAIFKSLLSHQGAFASEEGSLKNLRFVRSGAAAMRIRDIEQVVELFKVPFIDSYGMTETGGGVVSTLPGVTSFDGCVGTPVVENLEIKVCHEECPTTAVL
jgi:acyl-CoA synthetase (AMP-forming)/AMP-acid ligase II